MDKKISYQEVYDLITELGVELSNHHHTWNDKLKRKFNRVTKAFAFYLEENQKRLEKLYWHYE